jgi:hypothetical protein
MYGETFKTDLLSLIYIVKMDFSEQYDKGIRKYK